MGVVCLHTVFLKAVLQKQGSMGSMGSIWNPWNPSLHSLTAQRLSHADTFMVMKAKSTASDSRKMKLEHLFWFVV